MSYPRFIGRLSKHDQVAYETKVAAADFYRLNRVPEQIERALNKLFLQRPADPHGYLANYFADLSVPPRINRLNGREVYDARGQPCIEVEVFCIICNMEKSMCSGAVSSHFGPEGTSLDTEESCQERADHVTTAVQWVNGPLNDILRGQNPRDQSEVDHALSDFFTARCLEDEELRNREKEESPAPSEPEVAPPSAPPSQTKEKKSVLKGKNNQAAEKPFPPAEPPQPVLPGSMAIGSVSLAVARTGAQLQGIPLYKHIATLKAGETPAQFHVPIPLVTLLSCGKASPGKLSLLEEVILIPKAGQRVKQIITMTLEIQKEMMRIMNVSTKAGTALHGSGAPAAGFEKPEQPLDIVTEACATLGLTLGTEIQLAVNCAASELVDNSKGKYEIVTGVLKSPDELVEVYHSLIRKHPAVVAFINPFRREDTDQWEKLSAKIGDTCTLLSDVTSESKAPPPPGAGGHVLRHVHETTVSDLICIATERQGSVVMGTTCSEPCTNGSLSDIAVGLGLDYVKLGGLSGAERMTKYNRLVCIEEELDRQGILVSKEERSPPLFAVKLETEPTDGTDEEA